MSLENVLSKVSQRKTDATGSCLHVLRAAESQIQREGDGGARGRGKGREGSKNGTESQPGKMSRCWGRTVETVVETLPVCLLP